MYPKYHERKPFTTLDAVLEEHESCQEDFTEELGAEYESGHYEQFLIPLSWEDLAYGYETGKRSLIALDIP